ncbi:hypothetical protein HanXRQr2_Chr12g0530071 [Helianthus annuus]|uniref:Uncharacterized protein n=1 Tax=Helianthus annuus TaxID=4232 RepID=A0A251T3A2_HELAN|nr:hypothetical protein HanXRQr2_Chr12g0530071 [Helianthus annuus]KAJ0861803.1 hypothetical protein HanPSC8_Chr12g0510751 [Helianthus annuus]
MQQLASNFLPKSCRRAPRRRIALSVAARQVSSRHATDFGEPVAARDGYNIRYQRTIKLNEESNTIKDSSFCIMLVVTF